MTSNKEQMGLVENKQQEDRTVSITSCISYQFKCKQIKHSKPKIAILVKKQTRSNYVHIHFKYKDTDGLKVHTPVLAQAMGKKENLRKW